MLKLLRSTGASSARCALVALAALALSACGASPAPKQDASIAQEPSKAKPQETAQASALNVETPAGGQLDWVLKLINERGGQAEASELEARFDPSFTAQVPLPQLQVVFAQLSSTQGPLTFVEVVGGQEHQLAVRVKTKADDAWIVSIAVRPEAPHLIYGLLFQPDPSAQAAAAPKTWEEAEAALKELASRPSLYVARVDLDKGECQPVRALRGDAQQALGSTFKLYLLAEAAAQARAKKLSWESKITIKDEHKSLPSGVLQDQPAGTELPLREVAAKMISISDNTATDHLLYTLGRANVEAQVRSSGHAAPERMTPFMTTKELFQLKLGHDEAWRAAYIAKDVEGRRQALKALEGTPLPALESAQGWDKPRDVNTLEWFASGQDLCKLHLSMLKHRADEATKPAFEIMAINDAGLKLPKEKWRYVGYKGGSEPGVLYLSFLLERADGAWFSVSLGGNDDARMQPAMPYVVIARGVAALLEKN